ncbi:MAG: hypothetical protein R2731_08185 [Nocardioides sp.]
MLARASTVLLDPPTGKLVRLRAGGTLELRFRRGMSRNRWQVVERPGHLVPLTRPGDPDSHASSEDGGWALRFLVFHGGEGRPVPLRLELTRDGLDRPVDVRRLRVVVTG